MHGRHRIYGVFDNQLPAALRKLPFDRHLSLQNVRKIVSEADGYQPHLIAPEQGYRRLIEDSLNYFRGLAEASVDAVRFVLKELVRKSIGETERSLLNGKLMRRAGALAMDIDDSYFKQPGVVPFKWEIRPGVPKPINHKQPPPTNHRTSSLKPPPSSLTSFHFPSPRTQSNRFQLDKPVVAQPDVVSLGCFQTQKVGYSQRKTNKLHVNQMYKSDLEALSEWSMSTRKFGSPFYNESPLSSSSF